VQSSTGLREAFIGRFTSTSAIALLAAGLAFGPPAVAENYPVDEQWWPTEFGADDEAGATNYITPEKRLEAVQLVKQGKVATLGMHITTGCPCSPAGPSRSASRAAAGPRTICPGKAITSARPSWMSW
jgi:hypothetical protein